MTVKKVVIGFEVLIDDEDEEFFDSLSHWYLRNSGSGHRYLQMSFRKKVGDNAPRKYVIFHRHVMGCIPNDGTVVDHINGNTLDNRRCNLRVVDQKANVQNSAPRIGSSRFKGVHYHKGRYAAKILTLDKKQKYLGRYKNEIEAAYMYDIHSLIYYPQYGRRNFLPLVHG